MIQKIKKYKWILKLIFSTNWTEKKRLIKTWPKAKQYYEVPNSHVDMKELLKCALCPNMCRFECPALRVTQKEMYAPATKSRISYHMERGNTPMNDIHSAEVAYYCTNCNGCQAWCPMDISTGILLKNVRADLIDKEIYIPNVKEFNDNVVENKSAFTKQTFKNSDFEVLAENPEVLYYPGCVMAEKKPQTVKNNIEILKKAGINFCTNTSERVCCGGPLHTLGFQDNMKKFAMENLKLFNKLGVKKIITDCPACAYTMEFSYPELGFDHDFEIITTTDYFLQLINEGKLHPKNRVEDTITYHDPCYVARGLDKRESILNDPVNINKKTYENSARKLFSKIPGLKFKEVFLHGKETQCCGRGGVMHTHHPEVSDKIGKERLEQLQKTNADYIISACPSCEEGLIYCGGDNVLDISDILIKSLD